jgi:hypothetical protein
MLVFIDAEFTELLKPALLSLGLVTLDGREHYVELDLATDIGQARRKASTEFVRDQVLDQWGLVPGASCRYLDMGRRTGEWLLGLSLESGTRVEVAFDYPSDFELLERAMRDSGLWERVQGVVNPVNIGDLVASFDADLAAEGAFEEIKERGLGRHHALADAMALRASFQSVQALQGGRP